MVDVDALLALGIGRDHGAVGVEESFLEELVGLLGPDAEADTIDGVHQSLDVGRHEAPAEITFGGGIGNSLGAQGVEIDLVVATQLKMFEVLATGDDVESDVQDVVGFVVGQMSFEKVEIPIDSVDEADLLSQQKNGTDTAGTEAFDAIGVFVVDIGGSHHGFGSLGLAYILETKTNSPPSFLELSLLAGQAFFSESSTHSKAPFVWSSEDVFPPTLFHNHWGFSSLFPKNSPRRSIYHAWLILQRKKKMLKRSKRYLRILGRAGRL